MAKTAKKTEPVARDVKKRWTPKLAKAWTPVSDVFLKSYSTLSPPMTTLEAMFIVQLMTFKWDEKQPFPGFKTIGRRMGVTDTSARKYARSLEKKGYLRRIMRESQTNRFDLEPLFEVLEERLAEDAKTKSKKRGGR